MHTTQTIMQFVGVTTGQSSINRLFPLLATEMGLTDVRLEGRDLPLRAPAGAYRAVADDIAASARVRGALVTTHKVDLFASARDRFASVDEHADLLGEISCITRTSGGLTGHAKDPVTAGRTLDAMVGPGYFDRGGGHVLCLGAGGAGLATVVTLLLRGGAGDRPGRVVLTDVREDRLHAAREVIDRIGAEDRVDFELTGEGTGLLERMPPGSMVVNATGLGKDRPGSPLAARARFPRSAVVWDFNYRGGLDFLAQARAQEQERDLRVEDGWRYFVNGWVEHTAEVFGVALDQARLDRLHAAADRWRSTPAPDEST
ncbi:shikimate dehydrogenase family protein [Nocardiopsis nanhaiensis]